MNRRERLLASLEGRPVDRSAVCFYEINGYDEDPGNTDPFNIYSHPSWKPLIDLAREESDRIVMRGVAFREIAPDPIAHMATCENETLNGSILSKRTIFTPSGRLLKTLTRQDRDINTIWTVEPLLKDFEDLNALLEMDFSANLPGIDPEPFLKAEKDIGDTGLAMIDTPDPLCLAALLFDMGTYTTIALTEQSKFHRLLEKFSEILLQRTQEVAEALPGRLWRIYGPEFASPPYLPPYLFREYVSRYVEPMIRMIHQSKGYARIHCHGNIKDILDDIVAMGADAIDPIEPPPQGDVTLKYVRERYGDRLTLFGNIECADIENLKPKDFEQKVLSALVEGTFGQGKGFVLMPSASPYGRCLSPNVIENYRTMIRLTRSF
jgi:hypothetical protein